jgi:hypothetical protein
MEDEYEWRADGTPAILDGQTWEDLASKRPSALIVGRVDPEWHQRLREATSGYSQHQVSFAADWRNHYSSDQTLYEDGRFALYVPYINRYPTWGEVQECLSHLALIPGLIADVHVAGGYGPPGNYPVMTIKIRDGAWTVHPPEVKQVDPRVVGPDLVFPQGAEE